MAGPDAVSGYYTGEHKYCGDAVHTNAVKTRRRHPSWQI